MKILLLGPYPPPHGGVSVHIAALERRLEAAGLPHKVMDTSNAKPWNKRVWNLLRLARDGWTIHFHANGHNWKDWSIAMVCGLIGRAGAGSILTLHSGLGPDYISQVTGTMKRVVRVACALQTRLICVSEGIHDALLSLGVKCDSMEISEAYLGVEGQESPETMIEANVAEWMRDHHPLLSTALFFRPEYGFETLLAALSNLRGTFPRLGCVVMGSGEERSVAEEQIREAGLDANILLAGDMKHQECLAVMSLSDVFVRTTKQDGDSISVREALGLGVPVVASRTAFRPQGTILFSPGDAAALVEAIETALRRDELLPTIQTDSGEGVMAIYGSALTAGTGTGAGQ
jgi:glycogen synthase